MRHGEIGTHAVLIVLAAIWGGSFLFQRVAAKDFGPLPLVVGVTHADRQPERPLSIYDDCLIPPPHVPAHSRVPLLQLDARDRAQVRALVMAAVGLLEQSRTATA